MSKRLKFKIESRSALAFSIFYVVSGALFFYLLANDLRMVHVGLIGILSIVTALGVFKMEKWSIWPAFIVFLMGNAFSISLLVNSLLIELGGLLVEAALIIYLILIWIVTVYLFAKRENLH